MLQLCIKINPQVRFLGLPLNKDNYMHPIYECNQKATPNLGRRFKYILYSMPVSPV